MKSRSIVILLVVTMSLACYALGQAIFTEFTGTQIAVGPPLNPAEAKFVCPGGEPTGVLFPAPCTPAGSRVHIRGLNFPYFVRASDPRFTGYEEATTNCNFDGWVYGMGPLSGQMWGTLRLEVMEEETPEIWTPTGEVWEGTWTGTRSVTGGVVQSVSKFLAHGTGGRIEGLQARWTVVLSPTGEEQCEGRILAPGGK